MGMTLLKQFSAETLEDLGQMIQQGLFGTMVKVGQLVPKRGSDPFSLQSFLTFQLKYCFQHLYFKKHPSHCNVVGNLDD